MWLADDGSWGGGEVVIKDIMTVTDDEFDVLENGTDLMRQNLFDEWNK